MANLVHIAEVGVLLFAAFSVSWVIGWGLHRLTDRKPVATTIPADRLAAVTSPSVPDDTALVKAPVVDPVHNAPPPAAIALPEASIRALDDLSQIPLAPTLPPLMVSEPIVRAVDPAPTDVVSPGAAETAPAATTETAPAAVVESAPLTTPLLENPTVQSEAVAPAAAPASELPRPAELLTPLPAEPVPPPAPAMPASRPGVAYAGAIHGRPSAPPVRPSRQPVSAPSETAAAIIIPATDIPNALTSGQASSPAVAPQPTQDAAAEPPTLVAAALPAESQTSAAEPLVAWVVPVSEPEPVLAPAPEPAPVLVAPPEPVVPVAPPPPPPRPVYDEDAAMRAIEGGWSRRASRALPDAPELIDVSAAVAKAQSAVQQVLVQSGIDPEQVSDRAKPAGTTRPRDNSGDDLKRIAGISPLDEQTLNNLGIYRFEQISAWDPTEILWLENHAFARGRIVGEDWQGKARVLLAGRKTA